MENKKINILMVNPSGSLGGGNSISISLATGLDKNLFKVSSFFPENGLATPALKQVPDVNLLIPPKANLFSIFYFLYNFLKGNKIDIVHAHGTRAAFWLRLLVIGLKNKPKIVYTLHGFHLIKKPLFLKWFLIFFERFLNRWTDILVSVSETDEKVALKYKTIPKNKIMVIKNGIDIEKFQISKDLVSEIKKGLQLENKFILCSVGRLHPQKDFSTILRALKLIVPQIPNTRLLIIGDGPLKRPLEKETEDLGINKHVKFLGWQKDIPPFINLSDIIILSTKWEGLPLIPLEAGVCKKPIIASDVEGVREVIIDEKTGYLFKPGSEKDLAAKILTLYHSKELRKEMGENGYPFVLENFNKERMVREYQNLYESFS